MERVSSQKAPDGSLLGAEAPEREKDGSGDVQSPNNEDESKQSEDDESPKLNASMFKPPAGEELAFGMIPWATKPHEFFFYHPSVYYRFRQELLLELMAGTTVAAASVAEAIAFSFIAGVPALLAAWGAALCGIPTALLGSRPGMITASTGVRAAVVRPYIADFGLSYMPFLVIFIAFWQLVAGVISLSKMTRMLPKAVLIGFVNGLAIVLARGQVPQFRPPGKATTNEWLDGDTIGWMIFLVIVTILASLATPRIPRIGHRLPPSLLGIIVATIFEHTIVRLGAGHKTVTIGDLGEMSGSFPPPFFANKKTFTDIPAFDWNLITLMLGPAFISAMAGMVEALMTVEYVNDFTETTNPADQQILAMGVGNFVAGFFGTLGGGANLPETAINLRNGATGWFRISTATAGVMVLIIIMALADVIAIVPTAAFVGVMVLVIFHTFDWSSLPILIVSMLPLRWRKHPQVVAWLGTRKIPRMDALVIVVVTVLTVIMDLFTAVLAGVLLTAFKYAWDEGKLIELESTIIEVTDDDVYGEQADLVSLAGKSIARNKAASPAESDGSPKPESLATTPRIDSEPETAGFDGTDVTAAKDGDDDEAKLPEDSKPPKTEETSAGAGVQEKDVTVSESLRDEEDGRGSRRLIKVYRVHGPLMFASAMKFPKLFSYRDDPDEVEIHFHRSQVHDYSGMHALNVVGEKYKRLGKTLHVRFVSTRSSKLVRKADTLAVHFTYEDHEEVLQRQHRSTQDTGDEDDDAESLKLEPPHKLNITERNEIIGV